MVVQTENRPLSFPYEKCNTQCPPLLRHIPGLATREVCLHFSERIQQESEPEQPHRTPIKAPSFRRLETKPSSVDLDLTGSPLKADFDPNEVFDNSTDDIIVVRPKSKKPLYSGLKCNHARSLLSRLNVQKHEFSENCTNLVLCQHEPNKYAASHMLYLGNRIENGELVEVSKTCWKGPVSFKTLTSSSCFEEFKRAHMVASSGQKSSGAAAARVQVSCAAEFYLTGEEQESHLKLECNWDRSNCFLESPPPDSDVRLRICLFRGDARFRCDDQNTAIEQLEGLISGLEGAELVWLGRAEQEDDWSMEERIREVLQVSRKMQPDAFSSLQGNGDNLLNVNSRQDMDITDMLWNILSQCESFAELTDSLDFLFNTILAEDIRPFVYSGNQSSMAGLLRTTLRTGTTPDLSGAKPLSLLLEMGIEKLKRDSSHFLLSSDLASKEALDPYLSDSTSLSHSLDLIKRLHLVVEIAFACQTYMSLPSSAVKTLVHSALSKLRKVEMTDKMLLDFSLQAADVKAQLETGRAAVWRMTLKNESVSSTALLQVDRPQEIYPCPAVEQPSCSDQPEQPQEDDAVDQADPHYFIVYHTSVKQD